MSAGWVAGTVRARAMARRRLGTAGVRELASAGSLADALATLTTTPYGHDVRADHSLAEAQHAVSETLLWNMRVFAGWLPRQGGEQLRVLAGWFEVANVDELVRRLSSPDLDDGGAATLYRLGSLATAGPRLAAATSAAGIRAVLAASPWGDPGGETPRAIATAMRLAWGERVLATVPPARGWAVAAGALLVARELFVTGRRLEGGAEASARRLLGSGAPEAATLAEFVAVLPREARTALAGIEDAGQLWRAEAHWWSKVSSDAATLLRRPRFGAEPVVGTVAAAAVDAWRVCAALECAARGGHGLEVFDAVA